jgi:hypothetical protein
MVHVPAMQIVKCHSRDEGVDGEEFIQRERESARERSKQQQKFVANSTFAVWQQGQQQHN